MLCCSFCHIEVVLCSRGRGCCAIAAGIVYQWAVHLVISHFHIAQEPAIAKMQIYDLRYVLQLSS